MCFSFPTCARVQPPRFTGNKAEPQGEYHQLSHRAQGKSFSLPASAGYKGTVKNLRERPGDTAVTVQSRCARRGHECAQAQHPVMTVMYEMGLSPNSAKRGWSRNSKRLPKKRPFLQGLVKVHSTFKGGGRTVILGLHLCLSLDTLGLCRCGRGLPYLPLKYGSGRQPESSMV